MHVLKLDEHHTGILEIRRSQPYLFEDINVSVEWIANYHWNQTSQGLTVVLSAEDKIRLVLVTSTYCIVIRERFQLRH